MREKNNERLKAQKSRRIQTRKESEDSDTKGWKDSLFSAHGQEHIDFPNGQIGIFFTAKS